MIDIASHGGGAPFHDGEADRWLLADTARGRALECRDCGRVQVRFGNAIWVRGPDALRRFQRSLERQAAQLTVGNSDRDLFLTFGDANAYRFTFDEVPELRQLPRRACSALDE